MKFAQIALLALSILITATGAEIVNACANAKSNSPSKLDAATSKTAAQLNRWRKVIGEQPSQLLANGIEFAEFPYKSSKAHLVVVDLKSKDISRTPVVNTPTKPTSVSVKEQNAVVGTNGGFFNTRDGESTSYVYLDGKKICDPKTNKLLTGNPRLKPFLDTIYRRSELRFLRDKRNNLQISIAPHDDPLPKGYKLQHLLQGGPQLLPRVTDEAEAFVRKESDGKIVDSIGCRKTAARTAVGLTEDDQMMILCIAGKGQDEFSSGVTLEDLAELFKLLGCTHALNFDGGTSTTMVVEVPQRAASISSQSESQPSASAVDNEKSCQYKMVCGRSPETLVKSVLVVRCQSIDR